MLLIIKPNVIHPIIPIVRKYQYFLCFCKPNDRWLFIQDINSKHTLYSLRRFIHLDASCSYWCYFGYWTNASNTAHLDHVMINVIFVADRSIPYVIVWLLHSNNRFDDKIHYTLLQWNANAIPTCSINDYLSSNSINEYFHLQISVCI